MENNDNNNNLWGKDWWFEYCVFVCVCGWGYVFVCVY